MNRLLLAAVAIGATASSAAAAPKPPAVPATVPAVGSSMDLQGPNWPNMDWLYDAPSAKDSAGKVVVHWFCAPKIQACTDDLARMIALRDAGRTYVVAYINGNKNDAKKLDPIRESEGVGRGTVGFNRGAGQLMKQLGYAGPAWIIVGADGRVAQIAAGGSPEALDARDKLVGSLVAGIKDFTVAKNGPTSGKVGEPFKLELVVSLASWLKYSNSPEGPSMSIMVPKDIKCDATTLGPDKLVIVNQTMTGTVHCTAPRGSYEARAEIRFGYDNIGGGNGLGTDSGDWKFTIAP
jgi:hypothetical protein